MNENAKVDLILGWMYNRAVDNMPPDIQKDCPVIAFLRETRYAIKEMTYEEIESELGVFFSRGTCPCRRCQ